MRPILSEDFVMELAASAQQGHRTWPRESTARFCMQVREAAERYSAYVSPTVIREELKTLNGLAGIAVDPPNGYDPCAQSSGRTHYVDLVAKKLQRVVVYVRGTSLATRSLVTQRLELRSRSVDLASADDRLRIAEESEIASIGTECSWPPNVLTCSFQDPLLFIAPGTLLPRQHALEQPEAYLWHLYSATQLGRSARPGRRRAFGKQSRDSSVADLYVPPPIIPRDRARILEVYLALAWLELTGTKPTKDQHYLAFVESVFEKLDIKGVSVVALVRSARR